MDKATLAIFLDKNKKNDSIKPSHLELAGKQGGVFHIDDVNYSEFLTLLDKNINDKHTYCFTEQPTKISQLVIDIDYETILKSSCDKIKNIFNSYDSDVIKIMNCIFMAIDKYINCSDNYGIATMKKRGKIKKNDIFKDGLHIYFPNVITTIPIKLKIRDEIILNFNAIKNELTFPPNNSVDDIIDKSVITANGVMMFKMVKPNFGNSKEINYPYSIFKMYKWDGKQSAPISPEKFNDYNCVTLIEKWKLISLRNKNIESKYIDEDEIKKIKKKYKTETKKIKNKKVPYSDIELLEEYLKLEKNKVHIELHEGYDSVDYIDKIVSMIKPERFISYKEWWKIGAILHNIACEEKEINFKIFDIWNKYSKKYCEKKFNIRESRINWESRFKPGNFNLDNLTYLASIDNPIEFGKYDKLMVKEYVKKTQEDHLSNSTGIEIARYICKIFLKGNYISTSLGTKLDGNIDTSLYHFDGNIWSNKNAHINLSQEIIGPIYNTFVELKRELIRESKIYKEEQAALKKEKKFSNEEYKNKIEYFGKMDKYYKKIIDNLDKNENNIIKHIKTTIINPYFEEKLNTNLDIIPCRNGMLWRDGTLKAAKKTDYFSETFAVDYISDLSDEKYKSYVDDFNDLILKICCEDEDKKHYLMVMFGNFFFGNIDKDEVFRCMQGAGRNGKSSLFSLLSAIMTHNYCYEISEKFLSKSNSSAESATPVFIKMKGKRLVILNEPSTAIIDGSMIKKVVNTIDKANGRDLHKSTEIFELFHHFIYICNQIPIINDVDYGSWRRFIMFTFNATFTNKKIIGKHFYKENIKFKTLSKNQDFINVAFSLIMREFFNCNKSMSFMDKKYSKKDTENFHEKNNSIYAFHNNAVKINENSTILDSELYNAYKQFCNESSEEFIPCKMMTFIDTINYRFNNYDIKFEQTRIDNKQCYKYYDIIIDN